MIEQATSPRPDLSHSPPHSSRNGKPKLHNYVENVKSQLIIRSMMSSREQKKKNAELSTSRQSHTSSGIKPYLAEKSRISSYQQYSKQLSNRLQKRAESTQNTERRSKRDGKTKSYKTGSSSINLAAARLNLVGSQMASFASVGFPSKQLVRFEPSRDISP